MSNTPKQHKEKEEELPIKIGIEELNIEDTINRGEAFLNKNRNLILGVVGGLVLVIAGWYYYNKVYMPGKEKEASEAMFQAERYFESDSLDLAINGDKQNAGFKTIIEDYSGTKAGNLAHYYLGVSYLKKGQFQDAIDHLSAFSANDEVLSAMAIGLQGDAYAELNQSEKALEMYNKAAVEQVNNFISPYYMVKAGEMAEILGKNEEALSIYEKLKKNFGSTTDGQNADKNIARLKAKLGK